MSDSHWRICIARLFWLDDAQWAAIEPHLPKNQPGGRRIDDRRVISGIIHALTDTIGRPFAFELSAGSVAESTAAASLLKMTQGARYLLADKAL